MKHDGRVEESPSPRARKKPQAVSRPEARGTLDRIIARIDAKDRAKGFGAAVRAGGLIRHMRRNAGLSQQQLGKALGVTQARVSEIETGLGAQGPTWDLMERIAAACGRTVGVLPEEQPASRLSNMGRFDRVMVHEAAARDSHSEESVSGKPYVIQDLHLGSLERVAEVAIATDERRDSNSRPARIRMELRDVETAVDAIRTMAAPDLAQLVRLKKRRLRLKEELSHYGMGADSPSDA